MDIAKTIGITTLTTSVCLYLGVILGYKYGSDSSGTSMKIGTYGGLGTGVVCGLALSSKL